MLSPEHQREALDIARAIIRGKLQGQRVRLPEQVSPELLRRAGCFVTLHTLGDRRLRGCVGRVDAAKSLVDTLHSAAEHVLLDPRFACDPVRLEDLPSLEIEVSVLSPPRLARDPLDFDLLNDGIYLTIKSYSGCFLPQVARETGWGREELLDRLCTEKLGLARGSWRRPDARLEVFSVLVIGPESFERPAAAPAASALPADP